MGTRAPADLVAADDRSSHDGVSNVHESWELDSAKVTELAPHTRLVRARAASCSSARWRGPQLREVPPLERGTELPLSSGADASAAAATSPNVGLVRYASSAVHPGACSGGLARTAAGAEAALLRA